MKRYFYKPNMAALKGRTGKKIVEKLKKDMAVSDDNIRKDALDCKKKAHGTEMMENEIFYGDSIASCEDNLMLMKGYKTAKKTWISSHRQACWFFATN